MPDDLWADEAVAETLSAVGLTAGADADLPDDVRFVRGVREVVGASTERNGALSSPAVFVFAAEVGDLLAEAAFHPRIHKGELNISGNLCIIGAAAKSAHYVPLPAEAMDQVFATCIEYGLDEFPAVVCDAAASPPTFAWYPHGLGEPDEVVEGLISQDEPPTLDDLVEAVDRVHKIRLMTSFNQNMDTSLWEKGTSHWAHERAEKRVQDALLAGLGGRFGRPYLADQELSGHSGRYDIGFRVREEDGSTKLLAVLELKVARSFGSTGSSVSATEVRTAVTSGIDQVRSYANEHDAPECACLVFDLRQPDAQQIDQELTDHASARAVRLESWRCFPTAEDYRTFTLPALA